MTQLPAPAEHGAVVARLAVPTLLAAVSVTLPSLAPVIALATPLAATVTEYAIERPTRLLMDALRRGELVDLSDPQAAALVPMAYRFFLAARQGEYEHNLKLLAAFLTEELKSEACEPGNLVDMAKRLEGLTTSSLRAVALIGEWMGRCKDQGRTESRVAVTVQTLADAAQMRFPMGINEALDALSDLQGRGLLYPSSAATYGGSHQYFHTTGALLILIDRALDIAKAASCQPPTDVDAS